MIYIPSYRTKRDNSMIYRITCNVFFVHLSSVWKAQINIRILHHVTVSQALLHAYVSSGPPGGQDGPFLPAILQVMWHLDPLWLAHWPSFTREVIVAAELQQKQGKAQIEVNFVIFGGLTSWFFGLIMFWNSL